MNKWSRFLVSSSFCAIALSANADEIDDCIERKEQQYKEPQAFRQPGSVSCPAGDYVGVIPKARKHNRSATVTFNAPAGYKIENSSISSVQVVNLSSINGSYGQLALNADQTSVSVEIRCAGKSPGQGRAGQEIEIVGTIVKSPSTDQLKQWVKECVRNPDL